MARLSKHELSSINTLLDKSKDEQQVAPTSNFHRSTVFRYRKKSLNYTSQPVRGLLSKLTSLDKRVFARLVTSSGVKTAEKAIRTFNFEKED